MSDTNEADQRVASHTLTLLRRFDQRLDQLTEMFVRQQDLIGRLDRDMREGFAAVQREIAVTQRDMREVKSDMVLMENRIVSAVAADHFATARLNDHEDRLTALETDRPAL